MMNEEIGQRESTSRPLYTKRDNNSKRKMKVWMNLLEKSF